MVEYSQTDVNKKRKKRKTSQIVMKSNDTIPTAHKGRRVVPLDRVNVYAGEGRVELWWTDFGRLVIRTFGHDESYHADIDAVDLVKGLQTLCRNHEINDAR